jgi:hypothetical protein
MAIQMATSVRWSPRYLLDLDLYASSTGTTTVLYNDIKVTIVERGTSNIGFSSEMDEKSPLRSRSQGMVCRTRRIGIGFRVKMTKSIYYNGGGIDNL